MGIRDFRDLLIWQRAMEIARAAYRLTESFPASETYGLTSQIRRSAVSIASNIAEGHGRESQKEFLRFLRIARGSLAELQTQIILAEDFGFAKQDDISATQTLLEELGRMIRGMQRTLDPYPPLDSQLSTLD